MNPKSYQEPYIVKHILVVDDEIDICGNLRVFLEDEGFQVSVAHDGLEGCDMFQEHSPDLLIVDLHMPKVSGHDLLRKTSSLNPEIPKLVLSGVGVVNEALQSIEEGAWDFLSKPLCDYELLIFKIRQLQDKATMIQQNKRYQEHLEALLEEKDSEIKDLRYQLDGLKIEDDKDE